MLLHVDDGEAKKKVAVRLGIGTGGTLLTHLCTDGFASGVGTAGITMAPPIMDPNYIWQCTTAITNLACDAAPAPPR